MIFRRLAPLTQPPPIAAGNSSHVRPSSKRPPTLGVAPPTCLKKKFADPLSWQRSRISRTQSRSKGRKSGPLSPPTITQSMLVRSRLGSGPSSGSHDRNRRRRPPQLVGPPAVLVRSDQTRSTSRSTRSAARAHRATPHTPGPTRREARGLQSQQPSRMRADPAASAVSEAAWSTPGTCAGAPVVGFQVVSVHSIFEAVLMQPPPQSLRQASWCR